ncbi:putative Protein kinase domain [Paratrimastix pyriformis]|uniref:non-specific serine/threonine protein kinase n=1 Tax=Paratrimastix pyriformis TaxID=342808 RepID=A0ABQ8UTV4_9EUKA|nr:putative Protein kinase domain [Paratrimastix pyriformis]
MDDDTSGVLQVVVVGQGRLWLEPEIHRPQPEAGGNLSRTKNFVRENQGAHFRPEHYIKLKRVQASWGVLEELVDQNLFRMRQFISGVLVGVHLKQLVNRPSWPHTGAARKAAPAASATQSARRLVAAGTRDLGAMDPVDQLVHIIFVDLDRDVAERVLNVYANDLGATITILNEMGYQGTGSPAKDHRMSPADQLVALFANLKSDVANAILKVNGGRLDAAIKMLQSMYHGRNAADFVAPPPSPPGAASIAPGSPAPAPAPAREGSAPLLVLFRLSDHQIHEGAPIPGLKSMIGPHYRHMAHPTRGTPFHILGAGAFGVTFLCLDTRDPAGRTRVVVKVLRPGGGAMRELFLPGPAEQPAHPGCVRDTLEGWWWKGGPECVCLVTPYCEGGDLDGVIRRGTTPGERLRIMRALVAGLRYLHGTPIPGAPYPVLHNDLKPANVLMQLNPATGQLEAVLADLGLACQYSGHTLGGVAGRLAAGTPGFMAPEVTTTGNSQATDVYSMGCLLWCLYTGTDTAHRVEQHLEPDELAEAFAEVPEPVRVLLVRMCARAVDERPSIEAVGRALEADPAVAEASALVAPLPTVAEASALVAPLPPEAEQELRRAWAWRQV